MAISAQAVSADAPREGHPAEHEPKGKLSGQCGDRKFLWAAQERTAVLAGISVHGTLQAGTRYISGLPQQPQDQGTTEGLAACDSQTASPFGCLNNFYFKILSNFSGSLQNAQSMEFNLHGETATLINKNGATTIFWTHDDVLYHLYGTVSTDGLSKVAENIE